MKNIAFTGTLVFIAAALILAACSSAAPPPPTEPAVNDESGIANPASVYCVEQGGNSFIAEGAQGEYGICTFEDNLQCEEWAMMNGDCPVGGIRITGYVTEAAVYCAITGGEYAVTGSSGAEDEQGTCTFANGKTCDVWEYYQGECTR